MLPLRLLSRSCQTLSASGRPPPLSRGSQLKENDNRSVADRHRNKSTGISYLDTWIGNQNNVEGRPPSTVSEPLPISSHSNAATYTWSNFMQFRQLPSATYQMFSMRPTKTETPESLLERLRLQVEEASDEIDNANNSGNANTSSIIPVVLDLSAFHPDGSTHSPTVTGGLLAKFVEAIKSYRGEGNSSVGGLSYHLVGVAVAHAHHDTSLADEARSMKLPIFFIKQNFDGTSNSLNNTAVSKREKRGGVAPLLRQRRPGVAATNKIAKEDSSTLTTKDDISLESSSNVHIVGMGTLPPHDQADNSTKVHRGSIRSGQLLTSDRANQSLVIIGSVNPGGEVWSEGDVYVFGKLRGRVLAGLSDVGGSDSNNQKRENSKDGSDDGTSVNTDDGYNHDSYSTNDAHGVAKSSAKPKSKSTSKIFATSFDPELVCIGNTFMTVDDVTQCGLLDGVGPAMVTVDKLTGELFFEKIEL